MYITLNLTTLHFVHKLEYHSCHGDMVALECEADDEIWMGPIEYVGVQLNQLNTERIDEIYFNITGVNPNEKWGRPQLINIIFEMVKAWKVQPCNPYYIEQQIKYADKTPGKWAYKDVSVTPQKRLKATFNPLCAKPSNDIPCAIPKLLIKQVTQAARNSRSGAIPKCTLPRSTTLKPGSFKAKVFEIADAEWKKRDLDTDAATVKAVRQFVMGELEKDGFARDKTSATLSHWKRARI